MLSFVSKSFFNRSSSVSLRSSPVTSAIRWKSGAPSNPRGGKVTASGALRYRGPYGKTSTAGGGSSKLPKKQIKPYKDAWNVVGYSTAESFDLVSLEQELASQGVYDVLSIHEELNETCICAKARIDTDGEIGDDGTRPRREIFFFSDGSIIFWSVPELEREMVLRFVKDRPGISGDPYDQDTVFEESELMAYKVMPQHETSTSSRTHLDAKESFP